jgi:hypothetical protein
MWADAEEAKEEQAPPEPEYHYYGKTYVTYINNQDAR